MWRLTTASASRRWWAWGGLFAAAVIALVLILGASSGQAGRVDAACSNRSSDDEAINAAIARSRPGDEVVLDGPCRIDAPIRLLERRSYRGESRSGTVIEQAGPMRGMLVSDAHLSNERTTGGPVAIRSLTLQGDGSGGTDGIVLMNWQSVIEDVVVTDVGGHGILLTNEGRAGRPITNTQVNGRIAGNFVEASGRDGIRVRDSRNSVTDWNLLDNWIAESGDDAIDLDNAAGWRVIGNHAYGNGGAAVTAERLFGSSVSDNYVEDFDGRAALDLALNCCASSVANGNRILDLDGSGRGALLRLSAVSDRATASAVGNAVRCSNGRRRRGIGLDYRAGVRVVSAGNSVVGCRTPLRVTPGTSVSRGR